MGAYILGGYNLGAYSMAGYSMGGYNAGGHRIWEATGDYIRAKPARPAAYQTVYSM